MKKLVCKTDSTACEKWKKQLEFKMTHNQHTTIVALRGGGAPAVGVRGRWLDAEWCGGRESVPVAVSYPARSAL